MIIYRLFLPLVVIKDYQFELISILIPLRITIEINAKNKAPIFFVFNR